jgi:hypothetical protein
LENYGCYNDNKIPRSANQAAVAGQSAQIDGLFGHRRRATDKRRSIQCDLRAKIHSGSSVVYEEALREALR